MRVRDLRVTRYEQEARGREGNRVAGWPGGGVPPASAVPAPGRQSPAKHRRYFASVLILALLSLLAACGYRDTDASTPPGAGGSAATDGSRAQLFAVPAEQMSHVEVVKVEESSLRRVLRLTGTVAYNSFKTTPVITQVNGLTTRVLAFPGQMVRVGHPLLYVSSPDFAQLRSSYLKGRDAYLLAQKNYARAQDLYAHHAIAEADLLQAETTWNQAQADLEAAQQALRVLGIAQPDQLLKDPVSPEIPVLAPIAGEVVERLVSPGQVVQAGATQAFTISDMSSVWVLANVYEHDLGYVHLGDPVAIQTDSYPTTFHGRVSYIGAALDPASRTLQVRIVTGNPRGELKKDMYVTAVVEAGTLENALTVPDAAVLRNTENQPFVYVMQGSNQFAQRLVTLGESEEGKTQILSGLAVGEQVVADGSLFLQFANSFQH